MGWFDEQIRKRKQSDQERFEASILEMASVILGKRGAGALRDERIVTKASIDEILKYYHFKPVDIPHTLKGPEEQLEYALRPHGLMHRTVTLSEHWYQRAYGPMLAFRKADGLPVVMLPKAFSGYYYRDEAGNKVSVGKQTAEIFDANAICFYAPLPLKKIGIPDLISYMKGCLNFSDYAVLIALTLLVTVAGTMLPYLTRMLTGFVLESGNSLILWSTASFMLCVLIASQLLNASRALAMHRLQIKVALRVEAAMMMRLMSLPASFFKQYSSGELAKRMGGINQLCNILLGGVFSLGVTALSSLLYINQIFVYAPALARPALAIILTTMCLTVLTGFMETKKTRAFMEANAQEAGIRYGLITGVQKIKLSGAEKRAFAKWAHCYAEGAEIEYNPPLFLKISSVITLAISLLGTIALYFFAVQSGVSPSAYLAFAAAYGAVTGAFSALAGFTQSAAQIRPILEMAEPILKTEPELAEGKEIVTHLSGEIELADVYFRYNEAMPYVIDGMSLKIQPGQYLAIVGATGCGKSTLMRLLLGFEIPEKGTIYYDGKDMRGLDLRSVRQKMGVVMQDSSLFQGDIFSNIALSAPQLTLEAAWEAAELAGIDDDIRAMPMGMHTIITEGQGSISGGQKQRLMIARAVASKPKLLIFDEATSALDNKTQRQISQALDRLDCTRIVIAHRLSTVQNCDRILVLGQGRIIEDGTYHELMQKGGLFAELVERQRIDT